jgi:hypothetical protein
LTDFFTGDQEARRIGGILAGKGRVLSPFNPEYLLAS